MSHDKVFVCKYVSTPGEAERLQTGQNPISVSVSSIKVDPVVVGSYFADAQGRSFVLAFDTGQDESILQPCPGTPAPTVTRSSVSSTTCEAFTTTTTTTTTPFKRVGGAWVPGTAVVTTGAVTSTPTAQQLTDAGLGCPIRPAAQVVVTTEHATTCTQYSVRNTTVTTPYVLNAKGDKWVLGTVSTSAVGKWVISKPTAAQIVAAGLTATCKRTVVVVTENSGGVQVEAAKPVVKVPAAPVVTETSDGVQIAAANPLPSAARAGDADTGGQLAAGGLAGIGALLAMGAGFVLRRREGEV